MKSKRKFMLTFDFHMKFSNCWNGWTKTSASNLKAVPNDAEALVSFGGFDDIVDGKTLHEKDSFSLLRLFCDDGTLSLIIRL